MGTFVDEEKRYPFTGNIDNAAFVFVEQTTTEEEWGERLKQQGTMAALWPRLIRVVIQYEFFASLFPLSCSGIVRETPR